MAVPRWFAGCCVLLMLTAGSPCRAEVVSGEISLEMTRRAERVARYLGEGRSVHAIVFGDSISDGWGTDGRHVYHRMALDCLRYRFPDARIDTTVVATPGQTTGEAIEIVDRRVIEPQPDIVIVQFGGNDKGWERSLRDFRQDYAKLLSRLSQSTDAVVVACLPPIAEDMGDNAWSRTAREVATREGVPWADFHAAIGEGPRDFRGSFPYESHPGSFTHVIMAKALMAALDRTFGVEPAFECSLIRAEYVSDDATQSIQAEVVNRSDQELDWEARLEFGRQSVDLQGSLPPEGSTVIEQSFDIPDGLPAGRAFVTPVRLHVRGQGYSAFDAGFLVISPAIVTDAAEPRTLGGRNLTIGRHLWRGEEDLSARLNVTTGLDELRIEVHVTDDDLTVADLTEPSRGDSVEVYLDLRGPEEQGLPVYGEDVLALQIVPPVDGGALWHNLHRLPPDLWDMSVRGALSASGYRVRVDVPLAAVEARRGPRWGGLGLDVGVNDAD
ncbi:MAG: hypothetical protein GF393_05760 [Armatimonadia bacterium]|nr:hypothetical protein [Armatimonadia bacterium]